MDTAVLFIYKQYFGARVEASGDDAEETKRVVRRVLELMAEDSCTPSYIIRYHKDVYSYETSMITDSDIFNIQRGGREASTMLEKRLQIVPALKESFLKENGESMDDYRDSYSYSPEAEKLLYVDLVMDTIDDSTIKDLHNYYQYCEKEETTSLNSTFRRDRAEYGYLCRQFLLSPSTLALKLDSADNPTEFFLQNGVEDEEAIIEFAATDLTQTPTLIDSIRQLIMPRVVVSTEPTRTGINHPGCYPHGKYGEVKRIRNKPMSSFKDSDLWLLIAEGSQAKLIKYRVDVHDLEAKRRSTR